MHEEKRNFPRYAVRLLGHYELLSALPGEGLHDSEVLDVALRGCRMSTQARTELSGLRVAVRMVLAHEAVRMFGTIVWARPARLDPDGVLLEPGSIGVELEPPIPKAYAELVAELAAKEPPPPRRSLTPTPRVLTPAPASQPRQSTALTAAERLRTALRTGRDRKSNPPPVPRTSAAKDPADDSLGLLASYVAPAPGVHDSAAALPPPAPGPPPPPAPPAPPAPPDPPPPSRRSVPPAEQIDELLLDFLIETRTGLKPRPLPLDQMLLEFLADVQTDSRPRPPVTAELADEDIDDLLSDLSRHDVELLDQVRAVMQSSTQALLAASPASAVLAADDDPAMLDAHTRELGLVFEVVRAGCLEEALAAIERPGLQLCAVVSDLVMQGDASAGIVLQQQVRKRRPRCARILVSGSLGDDLARVYQLSGVVQRFIGKPWRRGEVLQAVQELLLLAAEEARRH